MRESGRRMPLDVVISDISIAASKYISDFL